MTSVFPTQAIYTIAWLLITISAMLPVAWADKQWYPYPVKLPIAKGAKSENAVIDYTGMVDLRCVSAYEGFILVGSKLRIV
jgi:hypothetical protein